MHRPRTTRRRTKPADQFQLSFTLAWLTDQDFVEAMRERGATRLQRVRFKPNRTRLITLSGDLKTLHLHESFRGAPDDVLDAIAAFLLLPDGSAAQQRAVERMRDWCEAQVTCEGEPGGPARQAGTPGQLAVLQQAYDRLNAERFAGRLPAVALRLSERMSRRFGHVAYGRSRHGDGAVEEIALNVDLLLEGNERILLDTLAHEMAHMEAWLEHGHRGHGVPWRRIAARVGCETNATSRVRFRRRRRGEPPVTRVPDLDGLFRAWQPRHGTHRAAS